MPGHLYPTGDVVRRTGLLGWPELLAGAPPRVGWTGLVCSAARPISVAIERDGGARAAEGAAIGRARVGGGHRPAGCRRRAAAAAAGRPSSAGAVNGPGWPPPDEARARATELLADKPRRLAHVLAVGRHGEAI